MIDANVLDAVHGAATVGEAVDVAGAYAAFYGMLDEVGVHW
jgi:hypothetical protein